MTFNHSDTNRRPIADVHLAVVLLGDFDQGIGQPWLLPVRTRERDREDAVPVGHLVVNQGDLDGRAVKDPVRGKHEAVHQLHLAPVGQLLKEPSLLTRAVDPRLHDGRAVLIPEVGVDHALVGLVDPADQLAVAEDQLPHRSLRRVPRRGGVVVGIAHWRQPPLAML